MRYVIIGNSAAAIGCIEGIRQVDRENKIVVISNEPYHTYSRPLISYLLYGKTDEQRMKYRPDDFYEKNNCETIFGKAAVAINREEKTVTLEDNTKISYDKLLIATGSSPFVPSMAGLEDVEQKFTFQSLDDAKALDQAINSESNVLIVGAGLIGLKCAEGIYHKVKSITVIDLANRILPSVLDEQGSQIMQRFIEKKGIALHLNTSVKQFEKNKAILTNGEEIAFDVLVIAVGVRPNVSLAKDASLEVNKGIVTNIYCQTSDPDIYAAGDCTESYDITTKQNRILALLPNAYMQGECSGIHMAGGEKAYDKAIPMNAMGMFGYHMISAGSYNGDSFVITHDNCYKKLITKDGYLVGFLLIGDVARAGIYTSLIREQIPLSEVDFELLKEKPQLIAFSKAYRKQKLGK